VDVQKLFQKNLKNIDEKLSDERYKKSLNF